jgi:hypothetical protein
MLIFSFVGRFRVPLLEIRRDSGYADRIRAYDVVVDGSKIGEVRNGEIKRFPISAGDHELRLRIDWCGSKPIVFAISEEALIAFEAKSGLRGLKVIAALFYVLFARDSYITLTRS